jgi:hypothetical protein
MQVVAFIQNHWQDIVNIISYAIALASVIVKLTPTLKDDNALLGVIKFLSKYIALNTPTPTERPK